MITSLSTRLHVSMKIETEILDTITRKVISFGVIGGLVVALCLSWNPMITALNPRAIPNPQYPTLPRLKGLRLRLMEPRTFEINCRRGEILFLCKLFIPNTGMETFFDGMRSRVKGERMRGRKEKVEGEESAVWMVARLKHNPSTPLPTSIYSSFYLNSWDSSQIQGLQDIRKSKNLGVKRLFWPLKHFCLYILLIS